MIEKPWGYEEILANTGKYVMKKLTINAGHRMSLQYHEVKEETIYVLSGTLIIWKSDKFSDFEVLLPGGVYHVKPKEVHRFGCPDGPDECVILECSTTELADVVRLADDYDRN